MHKPPQSTSTHLNVRKPGRLNTFTLSGLALVLGTIGAISYVRAHAATGFVVYSSADPNYATKVDFAVPCRIVKTATEDPIVYPGQLSASHNHTFSGNLGINANSTAESLYSSKATNCLLSRDHASYWMPTLYANGTAIIPYETRAYYRAGTNNGAVVQAIPFGLKMIAGDAKATAPQSAGRGGFQCRNLTDGNTVGRQSLPPVCAAGDFLESSIIFPNCWDGVHLDSPDHKSHMSYSQGSGSYACDAAHPVHLPQLTFAMRYPPDSTSGKTLTLASMFTTNSLYTLHADFINAWDPAMMQWLVDNCIHKNTACESMTDSRLPTGTPPPPAPQPSSEVTPTPGATPMPTMVMSPTPAPPTTVTSIPGDVNADRQVNTLDLSILLSHWGTAYVPADLDHNGAVNLIDLSILFSHWTS